MRNLNNKGENGDTLKVLYVSSEVAPYAKTGGLADVAGSLPKALAARGHEVHIVMPRYQVINGKLDTIADFPVEIARRKETAIVRRTYLEAEAAGYIPVYFIDNYHYFDRPNLYVHEDEAERFAFFCHGVLEMLPHIGFKPDLIHCNDWQSGPIAPMLKEKGRSDKFYCNIATLITVHNLHYQGNFPKETLSLLKLPEEYYHPEGLELYGDVSFIKAGLVYADIINTVSETYAEEIKTPEYGERLEGLLQKRSGDLFGIINGIDPIVYNPAEDSHLVVRYSESNWEPKLKNKYYLQEKMGVTVGDKPLLGLISRLVDQKGLDLIKEVFDELMGLDCQFVLLGSGDKLYEEFFLRMKEKYPEQVGVYIGFSEPLAKQIYAGADIFLMPSRFEPCGLGQLMALRYGTIPVVRATGGLADTIEDFDLATGRGNGFVFSDYSSAAMMQAINRALVSYSRKEQWKELVKTALRADFSWAQSAKKYEQLYNLAIKKHRQAK